MSPAGGRPAVTLTLDLEDHRSDPQRQPRRYPEMTARLLAWCEAEGIRMTVFCVGALAREAPDLVQRIAAAGHEIGCHSAHHLPLDAERPGRFRRETGAAKAWLEDLAGAPVRGYRAPVFSLGRAALWAADALAELGFDYSSSVLPAANPLHGLAGAPGTPFRWPSGLLELPVPVAGLGRLSLPFLGGIYLRYLPGALVIRLARRHPGLLWSYVHPYDFDPQEPLFRVRGASWPTSLALWLNRRRGFARLEALLGAAGACAAAPPLGERLPDPATLPAWPPAAGRDDKAPADPL